MREIILYKQDGYKAYTLIFEKTENKYSVTNHLSTENGYEEDLDYFEASTIEEVMNYVKEQGYEIH